MYNNTSTSHCSVCKFSLHYPHKISCLVMRIKLLIIHSNLFKLKNKIFPTCLQGNYRERLGEFSITSYGVIEAERVTSKLKKIKITDFPKNVGKGDPVQRIHWCAGLNISI